MKLDNIASKTQQLFWIDLKLYLIFEWCNLNFKNFQPSNYFYKTKHRKLKILSTKNRRRMKKFSVHLFFRLHFTTMKLEFIFVHLLGIKSAELHQQHASYDFRHIILQFFMLCHEKIFSGKQKRVLRIMKRKVAKSKFQTLSVFNSINIQKYLQWNSFERKLQKKLLKSSNGIFTVFVLLLALMKTRLMGL